MIEKIKEQFQVLWLYVDKKFFVILGVYISFVAIFSMGAMFLFERFRFFKETETVIQQFILSFRSDSLTPVLKVFTDLGGETSMILLVLLVAVVSFWKRHYLYSMGILFSVGVAEIVSVVLKYLIGRGRPPISLSLVVEQSPSFPSGHTIVATAFYGFLMFIIYKNIHHRLLRISLMLLCGGVILLTGFTRVYLGVHWPGDVVASYLLGGVWVALIIYHIPERYS